MSVSVKDHTVIDINDKKCIFRVPNVLLRQNPEAYTPDVVSIGPLHHYREKRGQEDGKGGKEDKEGKGGEDFQLMKRVKTRYLNEILTGMKITLEELTTEVIKLSDQKNEGEFEQRARDFYAEPLDHISSEEFIKMMIVDSCFLIQLFRKCNDQKLRALDDPVFNMDCMFHFLCHDILLLENQLPWFVIHSLYGLTLDIYPGEASRDVYSGEASLSILILKVLSILPSLKHSCSTYKTHLHENECHCDADVLHILDLVRASIVIPLTNIKESGHKAAGKEGTSNPQEHQVHTGNKDKRDNKATHGDTDQHQIRTATALSKADIKFKRVEKDSIMDIQFNEGGWFKNGTLEIPHLDVGMSSKTLFRNLIAFEQCYHGYSNEITSYAIFMDNLISSNEDMELLCKEKVIGNWMSDEDGCKFFSNLYKDIPHKKFYYVDLCEQVNDRYRLKWYTWLASLKGEKFSNPWRISAFAIGIFILILTAWSQINNFRVNRHK
ncbi:hypothetical protein RchiOBHm_Chr4g0390741 [Rosa chinensis]|uniref:DUF247 domain protein n=1 Tax=Rosa chinensis TaxID=74649 RepID=A0A2P6QQA4_ROSCH|nr:UPF0481 protein At3g47200 [Rosa chinensis]XP_040374527.1 UPF0481 protein At3g47200 [Rosa chinensis]PRQ36370.1 hypothetical protein RchiOBHm_Chr4g0390741 [Rosa chinensis]